MHITAHTHTHTSSHHAPYTDTYAQHRYTHHAPHVCADAITYHHGTHHDTTGL
jgi:hypothetical protein